jgi:hypothetical protein
MPLIAILSKVKHDTVWCQHTVFSNRVTRFKHGLKHGSNTVKTRWKHVFHTPMCSLVALCSPKGPAPPPPYCSAAAILVLICMNRRLCQHRTQHHSIVGCSSSAGRLGKHEAKHKTRSGEGAKTRTRTRTGFQNRVQSLFTTHHLRTLTHV